MMDLDSEVQLLLEQLQIPPAFAGLYRSCEDRAAREDFFSNADFALRLLRDAITRGKVFSNESVEKVFRTLLIFACRGADEEEQRSIGWTSEPLSTLATKAIDELACSSSEQEDEQGVARVTFILRHLKELLKLVHSALRPGTKNNVSQSFYTGEKWDSTFDLVRAMEMSWLIRQVGHRHLGEQSQIIVPCVLTALDHHSPPIKRQGLHCVIILAESTNPSELRLYKEVLLDAVHQLIVGSEEQWDLVIKASVLLVTRIEACNPRSQWYSKFLKEMIGELELHEHDGKRARVWLAQARPLFQALGLLLVAHFKRLFQLLFYWLRNSDKATVLEVLACLRFIIPLTWPRIPFHAKRTLDELMRVYRGTDDVETRSSVMETASLLLSCLDPETKALILPPEG